MAHVLFVSATLRDHMLLAAAPLASTHPLHDLASPQTEIKLKSKEAKVELQPKPINKLRLTLTATARLDKATVPSFTLGAKYDL